MPHTYIYYNPYYTTNYRYRNYQNEAGIFTLYLNIVFIIIYNHY